MHCVLWLEHLLRCSKERQYILSSIVDLLDMLGVGDECSLVIWCSNRERIAIGLRWGVLALL
jgi:hypothetical protein